MNTVFNKQMFYLCQFMNKYAQNVDYLGLGANL